MKNKSMVILGAAATAAIGTAAYLATLTNLISGRKPHISDYTGNNKKIIEKRKAYIDASATMRVIPMRIVSMKNRSGLKLFAHWYEARNATATIILVHGWHGAWHHDFCAIAPFLHDAGYNLLIIEQRCHNNSEGSLISYGVLERYDVEDWIAFTKETLSTLPLFIYGMSMGASTVMMCSPLDGCKCVSGIIADCGYTAPNDIITHTIKKTVGNTLQISVNMVGWLCKMGHKFSYKDCTATNALKENTKIPVLFIHGDADTFVPCEMTYRNYLACNAPKDILIVHRAEHGMSSVVAPELYQKKVLEFIKKCM